MTNIEYRTIRESLGTQDEVADRLGISRSTLLRRESDAGNVTMEAELAIVRLRSMTAPTVRSRPWPKDLIEWYQIILAKVPQA